jgi:hypothetical protein
MAQPQPQDAGLLYSVVFICLLNSVSGYEARIQRSASDSIQFDKHAMTSVTIDVCLFKQGLNTSMPLLVALTKNLGGYNSTLRIGGKPSVSCLALQPPS